MPCDTVIVVHLLIKKIKFVLFEAIGNISYEIFWVTNEECAKAVDMGMVSRYQITLKKM